MIESKSFLLISFFFSISSTINKPISFQEKPMDSGERGTNFGGTELESYALRTPLGELGISTLSENLS